MTFVLRLCAVAAADEPARPVDGGRVRVEERFAGEPTVAMLQEAAVRHAGLEEQAVQRLARRARLGALVPEVRARVSYGEQGLTAGVDGELASGGDRRSWRADASVSWSLGRLVFDRSEPRLLTAAEGRAARRQALVTEIARLYFARRRLQVAALLHDGGDALSRAEERLRIAELGAMLDGLTGGALSRPGPARSGVLPALQGDQP